MTLLLLALASAHSLPDEVERAAIDALEAELARAFAELELPDAPPIYHLRYNVTLLANESIEVDRGGIVSDESSRTHQLGVEVRVGTPDFDNANFGGWESGFTSTSLALDLDVTAVRRAAWRATDAAYKAAVEQYARKRAQVHRGDDHPGDYTLTGPVRQDFGRAALPDPEAQRGVAWALATALADASDLYLAEAHVGAEAGSTWVLDSEGARVRHPTSETAVRLIAVRWTDDGRRLVDQRLWIARDIHGLPEPDVMIEALRRRTDALAAFASGEAFEGEYVGPVLFEAEAAAELMRHLLLPQIEGTPPADGFDSWFGRLGGQRGGARLGRRVLPAGWTVVDDPRGLPEHPGYARADAEGTPTRAVRAVVDGVVRDLLMTRTPRTGAGGSTGHGRVNLRDRAEARACLTEVQPQRALSDARLHRRAVRLANSFGLDHYLRVERIEDPHARRRGRELRDDPERDVAVPPPVGVYRVSSNGDAAPIHGVRFAQVSRWLLRDVVAAGKPAPYDYFSAAPASLRWASPLFGRPCRITTPSLLVAEVELAPRAPTPEESPLPERPSTSVSSTPAPATISSPEAGLEFPGGTP